MSTAAILDLVEQLQAVVVDVLKLADGGDFGALSEEEFIDAVREIEAIRRQLDTADHAIVAEVRARDLAGTHLARTAQGFLGQLWRITPREAGARVREADQLSPRITQTGEVLAPLCPAAAAARKLGILNAAHTKVILDTMTALPAGLPVAEVDSAEQILVDAAHALHAQDLARVAQQLLDTIDPDGPEPCEDEQQGRRYLRLRPGRCGMTRIDGLLDPETAAKAAAVIGGLSAPRPDDPSGPDLRSAGQRRHDALGTVLDLALRADELRTSGGAPVTVHVSMTAEQFESRSGHTYTSYGQAIRIDQALRMADQGAIAWLVHNSHGGVLNYGRTRRLATSAQTEALITRDGGCAFPSCDQPPEWCQRHHIHAWIDGGETSLDNLVLLCPYHHARHLQQGWRIEVRHGVPWFIPPPLIDPEQTPLRNLRGLKPD
jgi:hypothetical protein